jgi:hypothetical protein
MKAGIDHGSKNARHNGYHHDSLSVKDAILWFVITVVALCIASTSQARAAAGNAATPKASSDSVDNNSFRQHKK